jgi:hypothetical protein
MTVYEQLRRQVLAQLDADRVDPVADVVAVRSAVDRTVAGYQAAARSGTAARLADPAGMTARLLASVVAFGPLTDVLARADVEEVFIEGAMVGTSLYWSTVRQPAAPRAASSSHIARTSWQSGRSWSP